MCCKRWKHRSDECDALSTRVFILVEGGCGMRTQIRQARDCRAPPGTHSPSLTLLFQKLFDVNFKTLSSIDNKWERAVYWKLNTDYLNQRQPIEVRQKTAEKLLFLTMCIKLSINMVKFWKSQQLLVLMGFFVSKSLILSYVIIRLIHWSL